MKIMFSKFLKESENDSIFLTKIKENQWWNKIKPNWYIYIIFYKKNKSIQNVLSLLSLSVKPDPKYLGLAMIPDSWVMGLTVCCVLWSYQSWIWYLGQAYCQTQVNLSQTRLAIRLKFTWIIIIIVKFKSNKAEDNHLISMLRKDANWTDSKIDHRDWWNKLPN
jgi:hypothetical protein